MNVFDPRALGCPAVRYRFYLGHVTMLCLSYQVQWLSSMKGSLFLLSLYGAIRKKIPFKHNCRPSKIPLA